jgi:hypothetical protein
MKLLELCAVTICVAGITIVAAHSAQTSSSNTYGNQEGRYRLVVTTGIISSGSGGTPIDKQYVIDTQTGRVWMSKLEKENNMMILDSFIYQNLDAQLSFVPNEVSTVISFKSSQQPDTNLNK